MHIFSLATLCAQHGVNAFVQQVHGGRLSLRLHSLLTSMVSPLTYGSQYTPSLARASFVGVLPESLHRFMRI